MLTLEKGLLGAYHHPSREPDLERGGFFESRNLFLGEGQFGAFDVLLKVFDLAATDDREYERSFVEDVGDSHYIVSMVSKTKVYEDMEG